MKRKQQYLSDLLGEGVSPSPYAMSLVGLGGMPAIAPGPASYYGNRYNPASGQMDGAPKSTGFYGPLVNSRGDVVSEYSLSSLINGKEVEFPSVVPGLTQNQLSRLLDASANSQPVPQDIADIAYAHAQKRINEGLSPFWEPTVDGMKR